MLEETDILNDIARSIVNKGGKVLVYREGRGVLGEFQRINRARGRIEWNPDGTKKDHPIIPNFWSVAHTRGAEVIIKSAYMKLEMRKISDGLFHVMIDA